MSEEYLSVTQLRSKDVVNINDGYRLGYLHDVNFDMSEGRAVSFIVLGPKRFFGIFGRSEDYIIPWSEIKKIGEDVILIESSGVAYTKSIRGKRQGDT